MSVSLPNSRPIGPRKTVRHLRQPTNQQAFEICCALSGALDRIYPGYVWEVGVMQDVLFIKNAALNHEMAWAIPMAEMDVEGKKLMRIGGEILEYFNASRCKGDPKLIAKLPRDLRGNVVPRM